MPRLLCKPVKVGVAMRIVAGMPNRWSLGAAPGCQTQTRLCQ
jgi:hypothetical protein